MEPGNCTDAELLKQLADRLKKTNSIENKSRKEQVRWACDLLGLTAPQAAASVIVNTNLTQEQVAEKFDVSDRTLRNWPETKHLSKK